MTSSDLRDRRARPCSPSAQRSASARLLLPEPFGPTTALIPAPNSTLVRSANDLKPWSRSASSRGAAGRRRRAGRRSRRPSVAPTASGRRAARRAAARAPRPRRRSRRSAATAPRRRPRTSPSTSTSIRNDFSWSGPVASTSRYDGRPPECRWVYSCSRLFGLLSARIGASATARARRGPPASRGPARSRGRGRGRRRAPRTTRRAATAGAGRCAATRPRRASRHDAEVDPAGETGKARGRDDRRAARRQVALVVVGMARVEGLGDGEVDHGVAEELEPLVVAGRGVGVLVEPAEWTRACSSRSRSRTGRPSRSAKASAGARDRRRPSRGRS